MKKNLKNSLLSIALLSCYCFSVNAQIMPSDTDCVLNWAETQAPALLKPHVANTTNWSADLSFRAYSETKIAIGVIQPDSKVLALGGVLGDTPITIGALSDFLPTARSANCSVSQGFISVASNAAFQNTAWITQNYIIQNDVDFSTFWNSGKPRSYNMDGVGVTYPLPQIDFSKYTLIGVVLDYKPSSCYYFGINRVQKINNLLEVESIMPNPSSAMICTMALAPAFDFVLVEKTSLPVKFINP